jgi:hypothetical protein
MSCALLGLYRPIYGGDRLVFEKMWRETKKSDRLDTNKYETYSVMHKVQNRQRMSTMDKENQKSRDRLFL